MKSRRWENESDSVLSDLQSIVPVLYQGFEGAMQQAREFFAEEGQPVDVWLFPNLVRYYALPIFVTLGLSPEKMNNNGLCINHGRYRIRSLKDHQGEFPTPGPTKARQNFWRQITLPFPPMFASLMERRGGSLNLIVMWEVTKNHSLKQLTLGCPKNGTHDPASAEWWWKQDLAHPALTLFPEPQALVEDDAIDDLDDYTLPDDESTGTGKEE